MDKTRNHVFFGRSETVTTLKKYIKKELLLYFHLQNKIYSKRHKVSEFKMSKNDFADAKAYLMKDVGGNNLYDHLTDVLLKIVTEQPEQSLEMFEQLSGMVKQAKFRVNTNSEGKQMGASANDTESDKALGEWCESCTTLLSNFADNNDEVLQDLHTDFASLKWSGVGFGDAENFRIQSAMHGLKAQLTEEGGNLSSLRFWGKILGTKKDYYICQGEYSGGDVESPENVDDYELGPSGPNRYTYWVCNNLGNAWTRLGLVAASHIREARQLRRFFTGDLSATVSGHPPFSGNEGNYLRAQIARITADCSLAPSGFFTVDEESGELSMNEEFTGTSAAELASEGAWQSYHAELKESGRCSDVPVADADGNVPEAENAVVLHDVEAGSFKAWSPMTNKACLRSNTWTGATIVGCGKFFTWCYCGYGQNEVIGSFAPSPPPLPMSEFDDTDLKEANDVTINPNPPEEEENEEGEGEGGED